MNSIPADSRAATILAAVSARLALWEIRAAEDEGAALLSRAAESGADFIVMGAYGHWRLRELIFGGTTRSMLASSKLPVFMAH